MKRAFRACVAFALLTACDKDEQKTSETSAPTVESACKHAADALEKDDADECVTALNAMKAKVGEQKFSELLSCVHAASDEEGFAGCVSQALLPGLDERPREMENDFE